MEMVHGFAMPLFKNSNTMQCNAMQWLKKTSKHPRTITPRIYKPTWKPQGHNKPKQVVSWNLKQSSSCKIWKLNTTKNKSINSNNHIPFTWFSLVCFIYWDQIQNLCKLYPMYASLCHFFRPCYTTLKVYRSKLEKWKIKTLGNFVIYSNILTSF